MELALPTQILGLPVDRLVASDVDLAALWGDWHKANEKSVANMDAEDRLRSGAPDSPEHLAVEVALQSSEADVRRLFNEILETPARSMRGVLMKLNIAIRYHDFQDMVDSLYQDLEEMGVTLP